MRWLERTATKLVVFTARLGSNDTDAFNITRQSGCPIGKVFAPSWAILKDAKAQLRKAAAVRRDGRLAATSASLSEVAEEIRRNTEDQASLIERAAWGTYVPLYIAEMQDGFRDHMAFWSMVLSYERIVLECYCSNSARCHRSLLAGLLEKFGATQGGEISKQKPQPQLQLFEV